MRSYHNVTGVYGLLVHAHNQERSTGFASIQGDLNQMSIQADVYPIIQTEDDFKRALQLFWDREVPGWWHYKEKMTQYGICTDETWKAKLEA